MQGYRKPRTLYVIICLVITSLVFTGYHWYPHQPLQQIPANPPLDDLFTRGFEPPPPEVAEPKMPCPIPMWSKKLQSQPWYPVYLAYLQKVDVSQSSEARRLMNCARWWHPHPHKVLFDLPDRGLTWRPNKKPPNYKRPRCNFGQKLVPPRKCDSLMAPLWRRLDEIDAVWFPRDGTEIGVVRQSSYVSSDGDMDIVVDMPQEMLLEELLKDASIQPQPHVSGEYVGRGVHWKIKFSWLDWLAGWFRGEFSKGCPTVHIHFADWSGLEIGRPATHNDTCTCMFNSVAMSCHKDARLRLFTEYGPSWRVPLHAKYFDCPLQTYKHESGPKKLRSMLSDEGLITEESVRQLDRSIEYTEREMQLILAHLNTIWEMIDTKQNYTGISC